MNLYTQLFIILILTYYLFFNGKPENSLKNKTIEKLSIFNHAQQYKPNFYDLNDLSQSKPKRYFPLDFGDNLDKKKIKYLKAINDSLDKIRLLVNKDKETIYNVQNRNPIPIENKSEPFEFIPKYLVEKLNQLSRNLYRVTFVKFINVEGEEIDEQYKVNLIMRFSTIIRKEGHSDTNAQYIFDVKTEAVINKPNVQLRTKGSIFFRSIFIDDNQVNDFMTYNAYRDWGN